MKERFLHYLWQYQLFNKQKLTTTAGESIEIQKSGYLNHNSGPDFLEAKIQVGDQLWAGSVEIHLKSSDWYVHNHETDASYDNVILHVVWEDDMPVFRKNNTVVSTLELKGLVSKQIWNKYQNLFQKSNRWIACESVIGEVDNFVWNNWSERLYVERLERKSNEIEKLLKDSTNNWEAVLFQLLAKSFGLKVNGDAFNSLAKNTDFSILRKERINAINLEALLIGQAGLLEDSIDDAYYTELQQIYRYQQHKYQLIQADHRIRFFRLRPSNFPNIRLSQLADLYAKNKNLFQEFIKSETVDSLYHLLQATASSYWDTHYIFGKQSKKFKKQTTKSFIDLLLINTLIPLRFTYQKHMGQRAIETLFDIVQQLKPEKNSIVKKYQDLGIKVDNAMDSQALLTLKNTYCKPQRCLECAVGLAILKD